MSFYFFDVQCYDFFHCLFFSYFFVCDLSFQGFEHHINVEHHIWAYIFFFIHLNDTKQSDYTSLELYVHRLVGGCKI